MTRKLLPLLLAVPLFPEFFRLGGFTPFAQLVAFRPQGIAVISILGVLALLRRSLRPIGIELLAMALVAAAITAREDVRRAIEAELAGLGYSGFSVHQNESPVSATSVLVSRELGNISFGTEDGTTFGTVATARWSRRSRCPARTARVAPGGRCTAGRRGPPR